MSDDTPTQRYPEGFPPPGGKQPGGTGPDGTQPGADQPGPAEPSPLADAPTERFAAPTPAPQPGPGPVHEPATIPLADATPADVPPGAVPPGTVPPAATPPEGESSKRGLIIALSVIAGVLLLALIGLLIWIAVGAGSPNPAPTETETPSPTPTASETPSASPTPTPTPTETTPPAPPAPADVITSFTASTQQVDCTGQTGSSVPLTFSWATTGTRLWFGVGTDDAKAAGIGEFPTTYTTTPEDGISYQCGMPDKQQRYTITVERPDGSLQSETIVIRET